MKYIKLFKETYKEKNSTFINEKDEYDLNIIFKIIEAKKIIRKINVSKLDWILDFTDVYDDRIKKADYTVPIIITRGLDRKLVVVDGAHRLTKAIEDGLDKMPTKFISRFELEKAKLGDMNESNDEGSKKIELFKKEILSYADKINKKYLAAHEILGSILSPLKNNISDYPIHYGSVRPDGYEIKISEFDLDYMDNIPYCSYIINSLAKIYGKVKDILIPKYTQYELKEGALAPVFDDYIATIDPAIYQLEYSSDDDDDEINIKMKNVLKNKQIFYFFNVKVENNKQSNVEFEEFMKPILDNLEYYGLSYIKDTDKGYDEDYDYDTRDYRYKYKEYIIYDDNKINESNIILNIINEVRQQPMIVDAKNEYNKLLYDREFIEYKSVRYLTIKLLNLTGSSKGISQYGELLDTFYATINQVKEATKKLKKIQTLLTKDIESDIEAHLEDFEIEIYKGFYFSDLKLDIKNLDDYTQYFNLRICRHTLEFRNDYEKRVGDSFDNILEILEYSHGFKILSKRQNNFYEYEVTFY